MIEKTEHHSLDWSDLSLQKRCKLLEELTSIYVSFQSIAIGSSDETKIDTSNKLGAPSKDHDAISSMIKIKIVALVDTDCPWITMNSLINHIQKKGGKYSSVSRDTVNRRLNSLISEGNIEKVNTESLTEKQLSKVSHNRTFNYVYKASYSYIQTLKNLKSYSPAPLDNFIIYVTEFISHLPEKQRQEIGKRIANVSLN